MPTGIIGRITARRPNRSDTRPKYSRAGTSPTTYDASIAVNEPLPRPRCSR